MTRRTRSIAAALLLTGIVFVIVNLIRKSPAPYLVRVVYDANSDVAAIVISNATDAPLWYSAIETDPQIRTRTGEMGPNVTSDFRLPEGLPAQVCVEGGPPLQ